MTTEDIPLAAVDDQFRETVKSLRAERGWSQEDLAALLRQEGLADATQVTVSRLETSKRPVRLGEAAALARVFELPISSMVYPADETLGTIWMLSDLARAVNASAAAFLESANSLAEQLAALHRGARVLEALKSGSYAPDVEDHLANLREGYRGLVDVDYAQVVAEIIRRKSEHG